MNTSKSEGAMSGTAIDIRNVSKRFKLYHNAISGPVKELLFFWKGHQYYREFLAVKNVSLTVRKGEIIGIIGPNGAGKTTLLKMIAGLLPVDQGKIICNGKVTALLALGVGIYSEFSGRENIYYGGILLGMSRKEVLDKMADIIEFAELGDFIDRPFRTYSSGMKARLLFAISMSLDPDILIVDEALATGDTYFVQKCSKRIHEICESGATILLVSHNLLQIESICETAIFMAGGNIVSKGRPVEIIEDYKQWYLKQEIGKANEFAKSSPSSLYGENNSVIITKSEVVDEKKQAKKEFFSGDPATLVFHYRNDSPFDQVYVAVSFYEYRSNSCVAFSTMLEPIPERRVEPLAFPKKGILRVVIRDLLFHNGAYIPELRIVSKDRRENILRYRMRQPIYVSSKLMPMDKSFTFCQPLEVCIDVEGK
jgi:ABC-type polysaccharide/polyol phosphate transport system ATPase subunit